MNTGLSQTQLNDQIVAEACDWFIEFNEGELDAAGRERFNQWLRRSPEHVRAYVEIAAAWEGSSRLNGRQPLDSVALVAAALAETNVVPLGAKSRERPKPENTGSDRRTTARDRLSYGLSAIAASTLLAFGIGYLSQRNTYTTGVGEQRAITLADGPSVELNARSRLRVRFSRTERTVDLIDGQALFWVKKDAARPFVVLSNKTRVRAVGTQFDVYRKPTGIVVTVIEGRVAVSSAAPQGGVSEQSVSPAVLSAGEQITITPKAVAPRTAPVDVAAAIAWTQRKLVFDETPLSDVVAEFNRYNSRQMILDDASLADYHIRGSFDASDPDRLIQFLRDRFAAGVREQEHETHIFRATKNSAPGSH